MTIKKYLEENEDFDFLAAYELDFVECENSKEAHENLKYVINEIKDLDADTILEAIFIVFRSYYNGTII